MVIRQEMYSYCVNGQSLQQLGKQTVSGTERHIVTQFFYSTLNYVSMKRSSFEKHIAFDKIVKDRVDSQSVIELNSLQSWNLTSEKEWTNLDSIGVLVVRDRMQIKESSACITLQHNGVMIHQSYIHLTTNRLMISPNQFPSQMKHGIVPINEMNPNLRRTQERGVYEIIHIVRILEVYRSYMYVLDNGSNTAYYYVIILKEYLALVLRSSQLEDQQEIPENREITNENNPSSENQVKADANIQCASSEVGTAGTASVKGEVKVPVEPQSNREDFDLRREQIKCDPEEGTIDTKGEAEEHAQPLQKSEPTVQGEPHIGHKKEDEQETEMAGAGYEPHTEEDVDRREAIESGHTTPVGDSTCVAGPNEWDVHVEAEDELSSEDRMSEPKQKAQNSRKKHKKTESRMRKRGQVPVQIVESDDECDYHRDLEQQEAIPNLKRVRLRNKRDVTLNLCVSTSTTSQSEDDPE